ncbi:MAG: hypothetical protein ACYTXA_03845 [Nostoc sp.]
MRDKHQIIQEPCEGKLSSTVLKTNGVGDNLVEFNSPPSRYSFGGECQQQAIHRWQNPEPILGLPISIHSVCIGVYQWFFNSIVCGGFPAA